MIVLENVLSPEELSSVQEFVRKAEFVDGKVTAGEALRSRKANEQLQCEAGAVLPIDQLVA